ncbi:SIR2 family NAD-dependent protein deacylase [Deinococcus cellulosilyticus]|uniref:protein acetyllysine N-acetyltransferase n=1 Tax=Deinococcus cellulosilyticus (strain DSM 18568 / NBRC 106333 / KACC 11606 / 5516J-15) TaxID=1223518 RepID=A0A511N6R9_DEIC1|nr:Sir2 family NAD-dependent protein deacetylase [Deinococcus cellulosilyticus]GEM48562.1 NAD-dependent protein deacylase [Deinococcus cellulosilyticus NBRC 106333 = KACC 11606]
MERRLKHLVVLSGAGISAESGLSTFRDFNGLWHHYRVEEVASLDAWKKHPKLVLEFYNERRRQAIEAKPNAGHQALAMLEQHYQVTIITQNVDHLHEQAGSSSVVHLHGELFKARSTLDPELVYQLQGTELNWGDTCEQGSQLRPHIVWFGEEVSQFKHAAHLVRQADIFIVVGTSLAVYPASSLLHHVPEDTPKYIIDPRRPELPRIPNVSFIQAVASRGLPQLARELIALESLAR